MARKITGRRTGATLVEAMISAVVTVLVVGTATGVWLAGAKSWYRGAGKIDSETQSRKAVKLVTNELAEAMMVTVDADGYGITFQKPAKDNTGFYKTDILGQPVSDGFDRRIWLDGTKLKYLSPQGTRVLSTVVIKTDPLSSGGSQTYKVFTPGNGSICRQVTVMVATRTVGAGAEKVTGRNREIVFLRNIYDTTR
ncbi:MAG: hypothetical protein JST30_16770 [Armatimonadetes bacterium]|nr:hypothetical protein [Armatimonadota bacterium]